MSLLSRYAVDLGADLRVHVADHREHAGERAEGAQDRQEQEYHAAALTGVHGPDNLDRMRMATDGDRCGARATDDRTRATPLTVRSHPHSNEVVRPMNSRQRRGVILLLLSVLCALGAFAGVLSVISDVNSKVGPEVDRVPAQDRRGALHGADRDQFEKIDDAQALAVGQRRHRPRRDPTARSPSPSCGRAPCCRPT